MEATAGSPPLPPEQNYCFTCSHDWSDLVDGHLSATEDAAVALARRRCPNCGEPLDATPHDQHLF